MTESVIKKSGGLKSPIHHSIHHIHLFTSCRAFLCSSVA